MKEKLEAFLTECPNCTLDDFCKHFETECDEVDQATPSGEAPMGGPLGILQIIRLIRGNWDTISRISGGRVGDFIRFVIANWSSVQDIIENLGERDIFETLQSIFALLAEFIESRQIVGNVPAAVAAENASDEEKAFAAAVCDDIAAELGCNLDAIKARFNLA